MSHRLFIALRPPPAIRQALASSQSGIPGARWQADAQLHITLRFIGDVESHQAEDVVSALSGLDAPALDLRLSGVGLFGKGDRINALWAGVEPVEGITALHHKIDRALVRAGLAPDPRAFLPHLTLARFSASTRASVADGWLADHAGLSSLPFKAAEFILYESQMGRHGSDYRTVERWPLGV
jgi:2'-5' RNA ligase